MNSNSDFAKAQIAGIRSTSPTHKVTSPRNSTGSGNGWDILYCKLCNGTLSNDEPGTVSDHGNEEATMLPDEITKYIAMMYVDWKLWHDSDRKVD